MGNKKANKPRPSTRLMRKRRMQLTNLQTRETDTRPTDFERPSTSVTLLPSAENSEQVLCAAEADKTAAKTPDLSNDIDGSLTPNILSTSGNSERFLCAADETTPIAPELDRQRETKFGRTIVNVFQFFTQLQEVSSHGPLNCGLKSVELVSEKRSGLVTQYSLKCKMCNTTFFVHNDNQTDELDLNTSAVAGTVAIGCGYSQLTDLSAAIGLAPMSKKMFSSKLTIVHKKWEEELATSMSQAAEEERNIAIDEGRVNSTGIPIIDVIADGCYSKRSYKKNYSALSGAAAIIGKRTNKILYLAIKNKYCSICSVAEKKSVNAREHICYKNYTGSSTGMESEILVEGFKKSIDMHNLIYGRLISDGDANTYSKILQTRPYANYTVEKIECRNHLLRNMCNKLAAISTDTKYMLKYRKCITKKRILSTRKVIVEAIKNHKSTNNVAGLYEDISIAPEHAFGRHNKCKKYFCTITEEDNIEDGMFSNSIWQRIKLITTQIAAHARSLIVDVDSNAVERYHSIVAKLIGGKRVNFCQRYQYELRCNVAALSFNTHKPMSVLHKAIVGQSPKNQLARNERNKDRSRLLSNKYARKKRRLFTHEDPRNYGEECSKPDMSEDMMEKSKEEFLQNLQRSDEERERICKETVLQSGSSEWLELRRNLLTASNFGRVIKRRMDVSCKNMVKDILYKKSIDHVASIKHGKDCEKEALSQLCQEAQVKIVPCGIFIDPDVPYLGATPDGLIEGENMIVEVKCPKSAYNIRVEKAIDEKKILFYKKNKNGTISINMKHDWYYQIQGQLHITRKNKCLFGIWSGKDFPMKTEVIHRDVQFWKEKMEKKLQTFYLDCVLPELIDPRHTRKMDIRDPHYIQEAIQAREQKVSNTRKRKRVPEANQQLYQATVPSTSQN